MLKAIAMSDVQQRLVGEGYDIRGGSADEFGKLIQSDINTYSKVIREANIRVD